MTDAPHNAPVVVGVEDSDAGGLAVLWAAHEAASRHRPLHLVRALDWPTVTRPDPAESTVWGTWRDEFRAEGRRMLDRARDLALSAQPDLVVTVALGDGKPKAVLRNASEDAALLVLGSRRLSSLQEALTTGSVAVPVIAHARCPVVVVRHADPGGMSDAASLVVGFDGSPGAERALAYAFDMAALRGSDVLVVRVCHLPMTVTAAVAAEAVMQDAREALGHALTRWSEKYPQVRAHGEVVFGHPVRVLADIAKNARCLVVGTRGLGGFHGMLVGSVSGGLVHHAECPLIVVPATSE